MNQQVKTGIDERRSWLLKAAFLVVLLQAEAMVLLYSWNSWNSPQDTWSAKEGLPLAAVVGLAVTTICLWLTARWRLRWYQVDLRTLGAATALFAVLASCCGSSSLRKVREDFALGSVKCNAYVDFVYDPPGWRKALLDTMIGERATRQASQLTIWNPNATDVELVSCLSGLKSLRIYDGVFDDDEVVKHFASLKGLSKLDFEFSDISDERLEYVRKVLPQCHVTTRYHR